MNKKLVRLTESDIHRIVKETVNNVLNEIGNSPKNLYEEESNRKEVFTIDAFDIEKEEDVSDMQYCGKIYYDIDDAIASATEFAQSFVDYGSVVMVSVYAGEYQTESGDIFGEPIDVYTISNSDKRTTSIARKRAGYVGLEVDDYAI